MTPGSSAFESSGEDCNDVAPILSTLAESMEGAYLARPSTSLLENTFWPIETNRAPPRVCKKMTYGGVRCYHDLKT